MSEIAALNAVRRVPTPVNEPIRSYAPGSPERAELKARLASMANERIEIPLIIGGKEIRTGKTQQSVMPFKHKHVLADWHMAEPKHVQMAIKAAHGGAHGVVDVAVRGSRGGPAEGRRAAGDVLARHGQRGDDAGPGEDGVSVGDRRRVRAHRLLALQRRLRAGALPRAADQRPRRVEPARVPAARRVRLRGVAVQLHGDRRQPVDRARADGRRVDLEAGVERDAERLLRDARASKRPACRRASSTSCRAAPA